MAETAERLPVLRTYKLYIGGAFPRTESGRTYLVSDADGMPLANACRASRKDLRDAVRTARAAAPGWAGRTAMNRGQILYRVAEELEGRTDQFVAEVMAAEGLRVGDARTAVGRAIDRWVWYAGWTDKISQVLGAANPVGAPYFNFTIPEPSGVIGVVAPEQSSLLGLVSRLAPVLAGGNVAVVLASEARPLPSITLSEVLATSDVPAGVVNVLTGQRKELVPVLAAHKDVDGLDGWGIPDELRTAAETAAADSVKRVARRPAGVADAKFDWLDDRAAERPEWIASFLEMKTVWHPIGV
jgi:acyl-CoA reductase-like NAD-dependent aldehyde dehydrogenase